MSLIMRNKDVAPEEHLSGLRRVAVKIWTMNSDFLFEGKVLKSEKSYLLQSIQIHSSIIHLQVFPRSVPSNPFMRFPSFS